MVGMTGFEPATSCPPGRRSTKLSYIPKRVAPYARVELATFPLGSGRSIQLS